MWMKKSRRVRPAAHTAPREVVIVEEGRRITGRLVAGAFVWTEEAITRQEWLAWCAANDEDPDNRGTRKMRRK